MTTPIGAIISQEPIIAMNDPSFSSVSLLLHMDGTNGSTTFTDSSSFARTVTSNGGAALTTTGMKYGSACGSFASPKYLSMVDAAALQMASGDFCVEFWAWYNSFAAAMSIIDKGYTAAGALLLQTAITTGRMAVFLGGVNAINESSSPSTGQWYHYALVRIGTALTLYRDGQSVGSATNSTNLNHTNPVYIAADSSVPFYLNALLDDFRITKGVGRYAAPFTPPLRAFPNL